MKIYICNNSFINFLWHAVSVNKNAQYLYIYITIFVLVCPDLINIHFAITGNHKTNNHVDVFTFHVKQQFSTYIY